MKKSFDIIIIGGGPVGWITARALTQKGFHVALIERAAHHTSPDERWFAFGPDICSWLHDLGIDVQPYGISSMRLSHEGLNADFSLDAHDLALPYLAGVVGRDKLLCQLEEELKDTALFHIFKPDTVTLWRQTSTEWHLTLGSGLQLWAPLVIGADGQHSQVRSLFSPSVLRYSFPHSAQTFTFTPFKHDKAYEHFFKGGSLAVLPLGNEKASGIWIGPLNSTLRQTMEKFLGHAITLHTAVGHFPLSAQWTYQTVFSRCLLLGDAAQVFHPIAGQGLNTNLRIARRLIAHLQERKRLGLDWGMGLKAFEKTRRKQGVPMGLITTSLVGLFSLSSHRTLWRLMAKSMSSLPFLRRWVMHWALDKP